ncbi:MAG: TlpA disulfide reductase family protein [Chloroflexota bacterium]
MAALAVCVVLVALLALMIWGMGRKAAGTAGEGVVRVKRAPDFSLPLFDGGVFKLSAHAGAPLVINFWASWCLPCEDEAPALEQASRRYSGRVQFLGIDVQDSDAAARAFLDRFNVSYSNGRDASGEIAVDYGMSGVPETYFVRTDGTIARKWQGPLDSRRIDDLMADLLR